MVAEKTGLATLELHLFNLEISSYQVSTVTWQCFCSFFISVVSTDYILH